MQVENFPEELNTFLSKEYFPKRVPYITEKCLAIFLAKRKHTEYIQRNICNTKGTIKFIAPESIDIQVSIQLYNNKIAFYSTDPDDISGIIIQNSQIYNTLSSLFDYIWGTIPS